MTTTPLQPVAFRVEGWHDGKLFAHCLHDTAEQAKGTAAVFAQHYTTVHTIPLGRLAAQPAPAEPRMTVLESVLRANPLAMPPAQPAPVPARCPYCDDTGDVNTPTGEWRGRCVCKAGREPTPVPAEGLKRAYALGWVSAVSRAKRIDLLEDMGSPAYISDMEDALQVFGIAASPEVPHV